MSGGHPCDKASQPHKDAFWEEIPGKLLIFTGKGVAGRPKVKSQKQYSLLVFHRILYYRKLTLVLIKVLEVNAT